MLSMETLVAPPLLNIPGVTRVVHRGKLRTGEVERVSSQPVARGGRRSLSVVNEG
jgi:hypothetical protein